MPTCMQMASFMDNERERLDFGEFLSELRLALGMDIDEVARRVEIDVQVMRALESGAVPPTLDQLIALARGFGMTTSTMLRLWEVRTCTGGLANGTA